VTLIVFKEKKGSCFALTRLIEEQHVLLKDSVEHPLARATCLARGDATNSSRHHSSLCVGRRTTKSVIKTKVISK
jgi:hypothetical protein